MNTIDFYALAKKIFWVSTLLLFIGLGLNHFTYVPFIVSTLFALFILYKMFLEKNRHKEIFIIILPLLFIIYCLFSPGNLFKDMPVGERMFYSYIIGLTTGVCFQNNYWKLFLTISITLCSCFLFYLLFYPEWMTQGNGRLALFFYHPSALGAIIAWCILFFVSNYKNIPVKYRYIYLGTSLLLLVSLLLTVGRSAYLGFFCSCIFLACIGFRRHIVVLLLLAGIGMAVCYMSLPVEQQNRIRSVVVNPFEDPTFKSRLPIWRVAESGIEESPLLGNSIRGFKAYHEKYVAVHYDRLKEEFPIIELSSPHTHNLFLGMPYAYGAVGTLLFMVCLLPACYWAWKKQDFFFLSVVVFCLSYGIFEYFLHRKDGIFMLFFPLGLVYGQHLWELTEKYR